MSIATKNKRFKKIESIRDMVRIAKETLLVRDGYLSDFRSNYDKEKATDKYKAEFMARLKVLGTMILNINMGFDFVELRRNMRDAVNNVRYGKHEEQGTVYISESDRDLSNLDKLIHEDSDYIAKFINYYEHFNSLSDTEGETLLNETTDMCSNIVEIVYPNKYIGEILDIVSVDSQYEEGGKYEFETKKETEQRIAYLLASILVAREKQTNIEDEVTNELESEYSEGLERYLSIKQFSYRFKASLNRMEAFSLYSKHVDYICNLKQHFQDNWELNGHRNDEVRMKRLLEKVLKILEESVVKEERKYPMRDFHKTIAKYLSKEYTEKLFTLVIEHEFPILHIEFKICRDYATTMPEFALRLYGMYQRLLDGQAQVDIGAKKVARYTANLTDEKNKLYELLTHFGYFGEEEVVEPMSAYFRVGNDLLVEDKEPAKPLVEEKEEKLDISAMEELLRLTLISYEEDNVEAELIMMRMAADEFPVLRMGFQNIRHYSKTANSFRISLALMQAELYKGNTSSYISDLMKGNFRYSELLKEEMKKLAIFISIFHPIDEVKEEVVEDEKPAKKLGDYMYDTGNAKVERGYLIESEFLNNKELDLSGLGLKKLPYNITSMKNLEDLYIENNELETLHGLDMLKKLKYINASNNKLVDLDIRLYKKVDFFDLTDNPLEYVRLKDATVKITYNKDLQLVYNKFSGKIIFA